MVGLLEIDNSTILGGRGLLALLRTMLAEARSRVWITQFVVDARPSEDGGGEVRYLLHALADAAHRGCDVRLILPILDKDGYDINRPVAQFLTARGVDVRRAASLPNRPFSHSKIIVLDAELAIVGNQNWTPRAIRLNVEASLACKSGALNEYLGSHFEKIWALATVDEPEARTTSISERAQEPSRSDADFGAEITRGVEAEKRRLEPFGVLPPRSYERYELADVPRFIAPQRGRPRNLEFSAGYWPPRRMSRDPAMTYRTTGAEIYDELLTGSGGVCVVQPLAGRRYVDTLTDLIEGSHTRVWVSMFGLRASKTERLKRLLAALSAAARRGVDVRVLYDGGESVAELDGLSPDVRELDGSRVQLARWPLLSMMHARAVVVDDTDVVIGSVGWTPQSVFLSDELSLHAHGSGPNAMLATRFCRLWEAAVCEPNEWPLRFLGLSRQLRVTLERAGVRTAGQLIRSSQIAGLRGDQLRTLRLAATWMVEHGYPSAVSFALARARVQTLDQLPAIGDVPVQVHAVSLDYIVRRDGRTPGSLLAPVGAFVAGRLARAQRAARSDG